MPRCPGCGWIPTKEARWECHKCHAIFNTFETGAICPGCSVVFKKTQCLSCRGCYPYEDWFEDGDFLEVSEKQKDEDITIFEE
ncbi:MAG: hypothetical protein EU551_02075 [Promethearchaeota archaeon]|nr:MAG: hypothetical protein EU551_02075 [Candidatus Lokiarchaeota archaeon]